MATNYKLRETNDGFNKTTTQPVDNSTDTTPRIAEGSIVGGGGPELMEGGSGNFSEDSRLGQRKDYVVEKSGPIRQVGGPFTGGNRDTIQPIGSGASITSVSNYKTPEVPKTTTDFPSPTNGMKPGATGGGGTGIVVDNKVIGGSDQNLGGQSGGIGGLPDPGTGISNPNQGVEVGPTEDDPIRQLLVDTVTNPQLPDAAVQTAVNLTPQDNEFMDGSQFQMSETGTMEGVDPYEREGELEVTTIDTEALQVDLEASKANLDALKSQLDAEYADSGVISQSTQAAYNAALTSYTNATKAIQGTVTNVVEGFTGQLSDDALAQAAIQDLDKLNPNTLIEASTHDLPEGATVKGQLDGLLEGLETGDVPEWAKPAMAQAESMLAARGMSSSSVGRQAMFNAVISAAMPIAQQDAKAKLSVFQQDISNEQQAKLANAQFFQNLTMQNLSNQQQTALANAATVASMDLANADRQQQARIVNAQNFLQMDLTNANNAQQAALLDSQNKQQNLLSNQAAMNAARQFNATSEQQALQFQQNLASQMEMFNAQQVNAMNQFNTVQNIDIGKFQAQQDLTAQQFNAQTGLAAEQFNAQQQNTMELQEAQLALEINRMNSQNELAVQQFNAQTEFNREQFNVQNATAIEQSNVQWRRQTNQINTAAQNAVNQANAMNAFNLSNQALTFLWQENRDKAKWAFEASENEEERRTRMAIAALGNEALKDSKTAQNISDLVQAAAAIFDSWGG